MPKKIGVGAALLAEFVAQGNNNKITIVNAYSGDVTLSELPATVAFGIYLELNFSSDAPDSLSFEVLLGGEKIVSGRAAQPIGNSGPATVLIPYFPCTVTRDSFLELYVYADGYAKTRALRKSIAKGAIPAGSTSV